MSNEQTAIFERLRGCIVSFDSEGLRRACQDALNSGIEPYEIISKGIAKGTEVIGAKFQAGIVANVRFRVNHREVLRKAMGMSHHWMVAVGDVTKELTEFCEIIGINAVVI